MSERLEERLVKLRITLSADPRPLLRAVRAAGLAEARVDVHPPMEEFDDAEGAIVLVSLDELANVLRNLEPGDVKDACLFICAGESNSDPAWCEVSLAGAGSAERTRVSANPGEHWLALVGVRTDQVSGELARRIERARLVLAGRETEQ